MFPVATSVATVMFYRLLPLSVAVALAIAVDVAVVCFLIVVTAAAAAAALLQQLQQRLVAVTIASVLLVTSRICSMLFGIVVKSVLNPKPQTPNRSESAPSPCR